MSMVNEVSSSNQRSVRKVSARQKVHMPKITLTGKLAKVTKGPGKKIGHGK
jgi:hypothetical protein